jgi:hypothetical protein
MVHNKSLQLSPWRSLRSVHAFLNSMLCWADAAAQLNSMLRRHRHEVEAAMAVGAVYLGLT